MAERGTQLRQRTLGTAGKGGREGRDTHNQVQYKNVERIKGRRRRESKHSVEEKTFRMKHLYIHQMYGLGPARLCWDF